MTGKKKTNGGHSSPSSPARKQSKPQDAKNELKAENNGQTTSSTSTTTPTMVSPTPKRGSSLVSGSNLNSSSNSSNVDSSISPGLSPSLRGSSLARSLSSNENLQFQGKMVESQFSELDKHFHMMATKISSQADRDTFLQEMEGFKHLFIKFKSAKQGDRIFWEKIKPPPEDMVVKLDSLPTVSEAEERELAKSLCVLKLNGGLGTSMGCQGPKSIIEVANGLTFLDITVRQLLKLNDKTNGNIPLILMDSFNTHDDTLKVIAKYHGVNVEVKTFNQSRFPRILKESLLPMSSEPNGNSEHWYPPGHGDVYASIYKHQFLDQLLAEGKEYIFISNIDNLGATVDFKIVSWMKKNNIDFVMEVTDKTRSDVKGGTLIEYEGRAKLFEIAQCPPEKVEEFKSIKKFKIFNTNNLWVSLKAMKKFVESKMMDNLDVIVNPKSALGKDVIQLETASGAAIEFFQNAKGVNVPRSRFLPVKNTSDLFLLQSDCYSFKDGNLIMNPKRFPSTVPLVNLGPNFKKVSDFQSRFAGIPSTVELDQLTVSGDVTFGSAVVLKGTVIVVANHGNRIDIPAGSVLENKVVSGNLRILDH